MDLAAVLQNAQSPDNVIRGQAEAFLNDAIEKQYGPFLLALTSEFATEGRPELNRQLAGLYIKNLITAQDNTIYVNKVNRWNSCDPVIKEQIKAGFLQALLSPSRNVNRTAAQVIGAFGGLDFPKKLWPQLLPTLLGNISGALNFETKIASLETLGYMCDEMDPEEVDTTDVNNILTAIVGSLSSQNNDGIRKAAITALYNSLDFTSKNFSIQAERDFILKAICESTQSTSVDIRLKAFECLTKIVDLYYEQIIGYIEVLYQLTTAAIQTDVASVVSQAIEFWTTIALRELDVIAEIEENYTSSLYLKIIEKASKPLIPLLLNGLTKQVDIDEGDDDNSYVTSSSAECLNAISRIVKDNIIPETLPFITANISSPDWHFREASITAFGAILEGPDDQKLTPIIAQALPILINSLKDVKPLVKESAGWTIARVCEFHKNAISMDVLPLLVDALRIALDDPDPRVVSKACLAIHNLAIACENESESQTNVISLFLPTMLEKLFSVANRPDWNEEGIRSSAYEACNMLISNSALDMKQVVVNVLVETLNRLEISLGPISANTSTTETSENMNLQSHLCSLISECIRKLDQEVILVHADRIMQLLLYVFNVRSAIAHEDAFLAIGFFADKIGVNFARYLDYVKGPLLLGLQNFDEYSVCSVALGVVGDICRALNNLVEPICNDVLKYVLEILRSTSVNRSVKPHAISTFSDIAMAIGGNFETYISVVIGILNQASTVMPTNIDDEDEIDYINKLRFSILEAYTGIIHSLSESNKQDIIIPQLESITAFIKQCAQDDDKSDDVLKGIVGLIGDIGKVYGVRVISFLSDRVIIKTVQESVAIEEISDLSRWTQQIIATTLNSRK
eukprot:gene17784-23391_t